MQPTPSFLNLEFIALTAALSALLLAGVCLAVQKTGGSKRLFWFTALGVVAWLGLTAGIAFTPFLMQLDAMPPHLVLLVAPTLVGMGVFARSKRVGELLDALSPAWVVGFQVFRVAMEIILWQLFLANVIPVQMTFEGRNFDILVGFTAPVVAWLLARKQMPRTALIAWNLVSMVILLNIVVVALLSAPVPFRVFMNEPANTIILAFPFVWLPTVVVPIAFLGHIASLRQVWSKK
jgi:hypothetical protein